jgi:hypothetical protein
MKMNIKVSQVVEPKRLLALGNDWNRICRTTPNGRGMPAGSWDMTFPWMLGWLSEVPEDNRDFLVLTAQSGSELIGILPLLIQEGAHGREVSLIGSDGCFGDCKGILASTQDQEQVGEAFGGFFANEWISQISRINFQRVSENQTGLHAFLNSLVSNSAWIASCRPATACRFVFRPRQGPDGEPIWPLASRRTIGLVRKAYESNLFEYSEAGESTDRQLIIKQAMAIRGMLKNDSPDLRKRFGAIPMTQRIIDYRFAPGTASTLSQVGELGSCTIHWKSNPIAGAMFIDYGNARTVFWMEVRVHSDQEQLVFWILFSKLIRSALRKGLQEIQISTQFGPKALGMKNEAAKVCTIQAAPTSEQPTISNESDLLEAASVDQLV